MLVRYAVFIHYNRVYTRATGRGDRLCDRLRRRSSRVYGL